MTAPTISAPVVVSPVVSQQHTDSAAPAEPASPMQTARAGRVGARWNVRVTVYCGAADAPATAVESVGVVFENRDDDTAPLNTVWTDWQGVPALARHIPFGPLSQATTEAVADDLAASLLEALEADEAACLRSLHATAEPEVAPRRLWQDRRYGQIVRDIAWNDPTFSG